MNLPSVGIVKGFFAKYAVIGLLLVIAGMATYHFITVVSLKGVNNELRTIISAQNTTIGRLEAENAGFTITNKSFKDAAEAQSKALTELLLVISTTQKKTFDALTRANTEANKYKEAYDKIFAAKPVSTDPCVSAEHVIKQYLNQRKTEVVK
jgi:hypothetical protein